MSLETPIEQKASVKQWLAVIAVALAIFAVVSAEILPIGLLTPIAETMHQPLGHTSSMIALPSFVGAITAPCVILIFNQINRRTLLLFFMLLLFVSTMVSAVANNFDWLLLARIVFGVAMGGIWSLAGSLAVRLTPPAQTGLATSIIFSGVAAASVLGVPVGVYLGDLFGWRVAFVCVAILVAVVFALLLWSLPSLEARESSTWRSGKLVLKNPNIIVGLALTLFIVTGHFAGYTFIRPLLQEMAQFSSSSLGILLLAYGICGIIGNFILGFTIQKFLWQTLFVVSVALSMILFLFLCFGTSQLFSICLVVLWGLAYGGVSVSVITWMIRSAPSFVELASSFNIAIFNLSIGLGSFLGGVIYDDFGLTKVLGFASLLTLSAAILLFVKREQHQSL